MKPCGCEINIAYLKPIATFKHILCCDGCKKEYVVNSTEGLNILKKIKNGEYSVIYPKIVNGKEV